jgi:hypothetical protein
MDWDLGIPGVKFYHSYAEPDKVENSVIAYDIENLRGALVGKLCEPIELTVGRVNEHYKDSSRVIKRSFGDSIEDDFQKFNWGFSIITDMGLEGDKLDYLVSLYCKSLPNRITDADFRHFIIFHSSFKQITDKREKRDKWMDLKASWRIYAHKTPGCPYCISPYSMRRIMKVNELVFDLDIVKMTKDMRRQDKGANRLHMLLLDDPIISGKKAAISSKDVEAAYAEQLKAFEEIIKLEEEEFGSLRSAEVEKKMKEKVEREESELKERTRRRREKEELRLKGEKEAKEKALLRLEEIRREREAHEAAKKQRLYEEEKQRQQSLLEVSTAEPLPIPSSSIDDSKVDTQDSEVDSKNISNLASLQNPAVVTSAVDPYEGRSTLEIAALKLAEYMKEKDQKKAKERADLAAFVASRLDTLKGKDLSLKKQKLQAVFKVPQPDAFRESTREEAKAKRMESDKAEKARKLEENRIFRLKMEKELADKELIEKIAANALQETKERRKRESIEKLLIDEENKSKKDLADRELKAEYSDFTKEFKINDKFSKEYEEISESPAIANRPKSGRQIKLEPITTKLRGPTTVNKSTQKGTSSKIIENKIGQKPARTSRPITSVNEAPKSTLQTSDRLVKTVSATALSKSGVNSTAKKPLVRESRSQESGASKRPKTLTSVVAVNIDIALDTTVSDVCSLEYSPSSVPTSALTESFKEDPGTGHDQCEREERIILSEEVDYACVGTGTGPGAIDTGVVVSDPDLFEHDTSCSNIVADIPCALTSNAKMNAEYIVETDVLDVTALNDIIDKDVKSSTLNFSDVDADADAEADTDFNTDDVIAFDNADDNDDQAGVESYSDSGSNQHYLDSEYSDMRLTIEEVISTIESTIEFRLNTNNVTDIEADVNCDLVDKVIDVDRYLQDIPSSIAFNSCSRDIVLEIRSPVKEVCVSVELKEQDQEPDNNSSNQQLSTRILEDPDLTSNRPDQYYATPRALVTMQEPISDQLFPIGDILPLQLVVPEKETALDSVLPSIVDSDTHMLELSPLKPADPETSEKEIVALQNEFAEIESNQELRISISLGDTEISPNLSTLELAPENLR